MRLISQRLLGPSLRRQFSSMKGPLIVLCLLMAPVLAWAATEEAICANAPVIFCDNFEDRATGNGDLTTNKGGKTIGWGGGSAVPGAGSANAIDPSGTGGYGGAAKVYAGSRGLEYRYVAATGQFATGPGYMTRSFSNIRELYFRYYHRFSNPWTFSPGATKGFETGINISPGQSMYNWWSENGQTQLKQFAQNDSNSPSQRFVGNVNGGTYTPGLNQWYCWEIHIIYNTTPTGTDGLVEAWVDDVLRYSYPNVNINNPVALMNGMILSGYWNQSTPDNACEPHCWTHPEMFRWFDNFVISTARIGCLSGTPLPPPS